MNGKNDKDFRCAGRIISPHMAHPLVISRKDPMQAERGDTNLATTIVGVIALAALAVVIALVITGSSAQTKSQILSDRAKDNLNRLVQMTRAEAASAESVFIPSHDIFGASNGYSFGASNPLAALTTGGLVAPPATSAHEIDFYTKDATHHGTFWAYYLSGATLQKYTYSYRDASGTAQGVSAQPVWSDSPVAAFKAYYLYASQIPSVNAFVANNDSHPITDVLKKLGFPEVLGGNRLAVFDISASANNASMARHVELLPGAVVGSTSVAVTFTPPPLGTLTVSPNPLTLGFGGAQGLPASGSFTATLTNYHHHFTTTACGVASITPSESIVAAGNTTTYSVTPTAVGSCTITVSTETGLAAPDNVVQTVNETITVLGALSVAPSSMDFLTPTSPSKVATANEPGYSGAFSIVANTCSGYATIAGGGVGPTASYMVAPVATTPAPCVITFGDSYGDQATLTVSVDPAVPSSNLVLVPNPLTITESGAGNTGAATFGASDKLGPITSLFSPGGTCGGGIMQSATTAGGTVYSNSEPNGYTCNLTYQDNYGSIATLVVNITTGTQNWVADWTINWVDSFDPQTGQPVYDRDSGTSACYYPVPESGGYMVGWVYATDLNSRGNPDSTPGDTYSAPSSARNSSNGAGGHDVSSADIEVTSCYDANNPVQPVEN